MNFTEKFYKEEMFFMKNIYITSEKIMGSDEDYGNKETFLSKLQETKKGLLDTHISLEYGQITQYVLFEEENGLQITYKQAGKKEKTYLQFTSNADYHEVLEFLKEKCNAFQAYEESKGSILSVWKQLFYTIVAFICSTALIALAFQFDKDGYVKISGSRRGLKHLLANAANFLGTGGSIVLGAIVVSGFIYYTYRTYKKSKTTKTVYHV